MPNLSIHAGLLNEGLSLNQAACLSILVTRYLSGKQDDICLSDIADATGLGTDEVSDALSELYALQWLYAALGDESLAKLARKMEGALSVFRVAQITLTLKPVQEALALPQDGGISSESAAQFTDTPLDEIAGRTNGEAPAPKKRGPYKKRDKAAV